MKPDRLPTEKELAQWAKDSGTDRLEQEEFLINKIEQISKNKIRVTAFVNVYLNDGSLYSQDIRFEADKRE